MADQSDHGLMLNFYVPADAAVLRDVDNDPEHGRRFAFPDDFVPSLRHSEEVIARWAEERRAGTRFPQSERRTA